MSNAESAVLPARRPPLVVTGVVLFLAALSGLFYYKWGGSLRTIDKVRAAGQWSTSAEALTAGGVWQGVLYYMRRVWIALALGVLIAATVRTFVSARWVTGFLGRGGAAKRQIAGGLAGAPLMLCSCCVTPIFTSVYEQGARLGSALAVMLAAPGLNLAALVLTFLLFPLDLSLARLAGALVAVLVLPALLERLFGASARSVRASRLTGAADEDDLPRNAREFVVRFGKSLLYVTAVTVPFIVAGVALSALLLPGLDGLSKGGALVATLAVGGLAVLIALPTFFEIPLALLLLGAGQPGAAAAMLLAGPIVNLPSLFVLARETNAKVSAALGAGIWLIAVACGVAVSL